jgi:tRNA threonylcarbamoyladenosine biosynthesis protein TsaE
MPGLAMTEPLADSPPSVKAVLDASAMQDLARRLAAELSPPLNIFLQGDLGAGKTTFARALIQGAGHQGRVKSPTYGILEHYQVGQLEFLHLDLYRIADEGELEFLGIGDLLGAHTVLLVEWPEHGQGTLPSPDLFIKLRHADDSRDLEFKAHSSSGIQLLQSIEMLLK